MSKLKILLILLILTLIGGFLRFYNIEENPPSLNIDEVAVGYNAYSILKTSRDENGKFLPLSFESVGDYKPPVSIYLTVPSVAVFGLNEFGVRFPAAFVSTLSIIIYYFFFLEFVRNKKYALLGSALIAISPWYIYFSRYGALEFILSTLVVSLGILSLLKMLEGKWAWGVVAAISLVLSMYTYHTERLFVPLFIIIFALLNLKKLKLIKKEVFIFSAIFLVLVLPLVISVFFGPDQTRAQATFITKDISFFRQVLVQPSISNLDFGDISFLFFYWARKFLAYLEPSFLFYDGLKMTIINTYGLGIIYLFELPWLILGFVNLIKSEIKNRLIVFIWIALGILPASLTINEQHSSRTLVILPMVVLISAIGGVTFFNLIRQHFSIKFRAFLYFLFGGFVIWNFSLAYLIFTVHFPRQRGEAFMEGTKQVVQFALDHKDQYQKIVFDPYRGVEGPYIVSIPHIYILFYSQYDPATYQKIPRYQGYELYEFDKFIVRKINWREDRGKKGILFIGSPWVLPEPDVKSEEILQRVYLSNGKLAFLIVSLK